MTKGVWIGVLISGVIVSIALLYLYNFNPYFTETKSRMIKSLFFIIGYEFIVWSIIRGVMGQYERRQWYEKMFYNLSGILLFFILPFLFLTTLLLVVLGHEY